MVFIEFLSLLSLLSCTNTYKEFSIICVSFIKKKEIKITENNPMLKFPRVPITEFSKLGIAVMFLNKSAFFNSFKISIF